MQLTCGFCQRNVATDAWHLGHRCVVAFELVVECAAGHHEPLAPASCFSVLHAQTVVATMWLVLLSQQSSIDFVIRDAQLAMQHWMESLLSRDGDLDDDSVVLALKASGSLLASFDGAIPPIAVATHDVFVVFVEIICDRVVVLVFISAAVPQCRRTAKIAVFHADLCIIGQGNVANLRGRTPTYVSSDAFLEFGFCIRIGQSWRGHGRMQEAGNG